MFRTFQDSGNPKAKGSGDLQYSGSDQYSVMISHCHDRHYLLIFIMMKEANNQRDMASSNHRYEHYHDYNHHDFQSQSSSLSS